MKNNDTKKDKITYSDLTDRQKRIYNKIDFDLLSFMNYEKAIILKLLFEKYQKYY